MNVVMSVGILLALALPLAAHHSFSAEFDGSKQVTLDGTVVKMDWVNPHSWLYVDVTKPDGSVEHWKVEGGSPSVLLRLGWNRDSLPVAPRSKSSDHPRRTARCASIPGVSNFRMVKKCPWAVRTLTPNSRSRRLR